jgi:hypothetical protein
MHVWEILLVDYCKQANKDLVILRAAFSATRRISIFGFL